MTHSPSSHESAPRCRQTSVKASAKTPPHHTAQKMIWNSINQREDPVMGP